MRPENLKTKIFLDSSDTQETKQLLDCMGFLDGQTTNPSLVAKNPKVQELIRQKGSLSTQELLDFYKQNIQEISGLIPEGSVSIEVYADDKSTTEDLVKQAKEMQTWIPNNHIKFPTTAQGLGAANRIISAGGRVNMTLVFTQGQAAAVHAATKGAKAGDVFLSPFIGRLNDIGVDGMDLIKNTIQMYKENDSCVQVLSASVRTLDQFIKCIELESDIITAPFEVIKEWADSGMPTTGTKYSSEGLEEIPFEKIDLGKEYIKYDISYLLTDKGQSKFADDWNSILNDK